MHCEKQELSAPRGRDAAAGPPSSTFASKLALLAQLQFDNQYSLAIITNSLKLAALLHTPFAYLLLEAEPIALAAQAQLGLIENAPLYRLLQALLCFVKVVQLVALVVAVRGRQESMAWGLSAKLVRVSLPISEADLFLSSFLLLANLQQNILPFLYSSSLSILLNIVGENYTNRKIASYQSSQIGSISSKLMQVTLLVGNSAMAAIGSPFYFYVFNFATAPAVLYWYYQYGVKLYIATALKNLALAYITLYSSLLFLFIERVLLRTDIFALTNIAKWALLMPVLLCSWVVCARGMRVQGGKAMKDIDLEWHQLLGESASDSQSDSLVVGALKLHQRLECGNLRCYSHASSCYDPAVKARVSTKQLREKESTVRFYIKCLYQQAAASPAPSLFLDFAEFVLCEGFDLYLLGKLLSLDENCLGLLDVVRLRRLKAAVREESCRLNRLIFGGTLPIEHVIAAEETFADISQGVSHYLTENLSIWETVSSADVNVTSLRQKIIGNFALLDHLNDKWNSIHAYLPLQSKWRLYYKHYCLFVLNERARQKGEEEKEKEQKELPYLSPEAKKDVLFSSSFLFHSSTMYLHAYLLNSIAYVATSNRAFQEIAAYTAGELAGMELKELLPSESAAIHDKSMMRWLQQGESNNDEEYPIRFTQLKTKDGSCLPVIKYFKVIVNAHATNQHFLEFVCMLKLNSNRLILPTQRSITAAALPITPESVNANFLQKEVKVVLRADSNPFLKEENLKPVRRMGELVRLKRGLRLVLGVLLLITVGLLLLTLKNANDLNSYSIQYINFLNLYRYPMAFGKNVLKTILNVGNQTKAVNQIHLEVTQIAQFLNDPMTIESIFDESLNVPRLYYPFQNNSFNRGIAYNQIDLIYYLTSTIQSLNALPVNRTGEYFTNFNMYLAPAYDSLINSTKIRFHDSFSTIFTSMRNNQLIVLAAEVAVFVFAVAYLTCTLARFFSKNRDNLRVIIEFTEQDATKLICYSKRLRLFFASFATKQEQGGTARELSRLQLTEERLLQHADARLTQISLNKRSKNIYRSGKEERRDARCIGVLVLLLVVVLAVILTFQTVNIIAIDQLQVFEEDGFYFLRYFPATSVLGHAILERYYNQLYPKEIGFYPQRYAESIADLSLIAHTDYIGRPELEDSPYFQEQKNYLFGNPCTSNPEVLVAAQTTLAKCLSIYNRTFSQGITAFLRACEPQVGAFLRKQLNLTSAQVDEVTTALTLVAYYITDAIAEWSSEFSDMVGDFKVRNWVLCTGICLFLLLFHLVSCECVVLPQLEEEHSLMRRVYCHMVPQEILLREKVIKQKFIINGLLPQD